MKQVVSFLTALVLAFGCAASFAADRADTKSEPNVFAVVERVNINTADAETISKALHRVGLKKAQAIIEWRKANGKFSSHEQLLEVKGIGKATLENNRDRILL
ncbi:competence protein ComE [Proteobacteria bacterium 005FR1]|nr:competence protein ComE [Proteobacteria bacterium 005FR1]